jgi:hypothetical protein
MQTLLNIAFGAVLAGFSLGPAAWADVERTSAHLSQTVATVVHFQGARSPIERVIAQPALPHLTSGAH